MGLETMGALFSRAKLLGALGLLCLPFSAVQANGSSGTFTITAVTVEGNAVYIKGNAQNPDNCQDPTLMIVVTSTEAEKDRFLSLATTALVSRQPVVAYFENCAQTHWGFSIPRVTSLTMQSS